MVLSLLKNDIVSSNCRSSRRARAIEGRPTDLGYQYAQKSAPAKTCNRWIVIQMLDPWAMRRRYFRDAPNVVDLDQQYSCRQLTITRFSFLASSRCIGAPSRSLGAAEV